MLPLFYYKEELMQITLNKKLYTSKPVSFGVVLDVIKLQKKLAEREDVFTKGLSDDEVYNFFSKIDPEKDLFDNLNILIKFFGNQFTVDEFLKGYQASSMRDFENLLYIMIMEVSSGVKDEVGAEKKPQTKTLKMKG